MSEADEFGHAAWLALNKFGSPFFQECTDGLPSVCFSGYAFPFVSYSMASRMFCESWKAGNLVRADLLELADPGFVEPVLTLSQLFRADSMKGTTNA